MAGNLLRVVILFFVFTPLSALAQRCEEAVATLESLEGTGSYQTQDMEEWQPVAVGFKFCYGDTLKIEEFRAALRLENATLVRLNEGSIVRFVPPKKSFWLELVEGAAHFISRTPKIFTVKMPYLNAGVEGTEFVVRHEAEQDTVAVFEGVVSVSNEVDKVQLTKMEQVSGNENSSLQNKIKISIEGVVDWALRYPPTLLEFSNIPANIQESLNSNNISEALARLEALSPTQSSINSELLKASLYLNQGQIANAKQALHNAEEINPGSNELNTLQVLVSLIEGQSLQALEQSKKLVANEASSPLINLVHSYALQANFQLEQALKFAEKSAEQQANSYLIWNRVAELALNTNNIKLAQKALKKSENLNKGNPDTLTLKGFVKLKQNKYKAAKKYFEEAVATSNDSFANFALGLVTIRLGDLKKGRELIELATLLDPNNSLYRSYLGKAYADEYRFENAHEQYELAKILDANDPTPYFYEALRLRALNQPHRAIDALNDSIQKNDNRAVYRSRYMLDADTAARNASLSSIYLDLGFDEQAQMLAGESLAKDPTDFAAHKFYAESLFNNHQVDATRVSEILQAQLLQPVTANPIRPSLAESDLNVPDIAGPTYISLNEYNSIFNRNEHNASIYTSKGSNSTDLVNIFLSGLENHTSYALEHYEYQTDGFRENNDQFIQISGASFSQELSPSIRSFAEFRRRKNRFGDISIGLSNVPSQENLRTSETSEVQRLAFNYSNNSTFSVVTALSKTSYKDSTTNYSLIASTPNFDVYQDYRFNSEKDHQSSELRFYLNKELFSVTSGLSYTDIEDLAHRSVQAVGPPNNPDPQILKINEKDRVKQLYTQSTIKAISNIKVLAGLKYFKGGGSEKYLYETAVQYDYNNILLSFAYFQNIKPPAIVEGSISPTNILGIPTKFDDFNYSKSNNLGIAMKYEIARHLSFGSILYRRKITTPTLQGDNNSFKVKQGSIFANVSSKRFSLTITPTVNDEQFSYQNSQILTGSQPISIESTTIPVKLLFHIHENINLGIEHISEVQKTQYFSQGKKSNTSNLNFSLTSSQNDENKNQINYFFKIYNVLDRELQYQPSITLDKTSRPRHLYPSTFYSIGLLLRF